MATEPLQAAPYAVGTDAPDGPTQLLALANWARLKVVQVYATSAARTAAFTAAGVSPTEGMLSWLQDINRYERHDGTRWVPLGAQACGVRLERAAVQSVGQSAVGAITWDTERSDTDNIWSSGAVITIPTGLGGVWAASFTTSSNATGRQFLQCDVTGNPAGAPQTYRQPMDPGNPALGLLSIPCLPVSDAGTLTFGAFHVSGGPANFTAQLTLRRISD